MRNRSHKAPQYCDVVYEPSIDVEGVRKAPDYAFRVGRDVKFYVEAKKPGVALRTNAAAAYQLRAYAWNVKLPLSVLTDFDEWVVYDCRSKPSLADKPSVGRVAYHTFEEYPDCWRELWDTFSYEAVWSGAFDQFAQTSKSKRGTSEVDTEFLKEIEDWRDKLAHNIALRNPRLSVDELNDAVQRTIDRIIFLRMAEDRGIEEYERLLRLTLTPTLPLPGGGQPVPRPQGVGGGGIYPGLIDLCRQADAKYNAGLFDLRADKLTPKLAIDDKVLRPILADMYYPQSPYRFDLLPTEILGNIYEQFLGKVIRLTPAHQAKVEEKPEVKKAGGVYYTPAYIVAYIVKNTVGKWIEDNVGAVRARAVRVRAVREPPQQRDSPLPDTFRVLDPACGSGSFLLGAYQYLLDYYLQWYTDHNPEKHPKAVWAVRVRAVREPPQQRDSASPSPVPRGRVRVGVNGGSPPPKKSASSPRTSLA